MTIPVSVCLPIYNASRYLRECLDSILSQSFTAFELLIVDDGSTDDSCGIVASYDDPRIRLIRNRHDYIGSLNLLLHEARGKYLARMDADDVMLPGRLQVQYDYMEAHPDIDVWAGGYVSVENEKLKRVPGVLNRPLRLSDMRQHNLFGNPATIIRMDTFRNFGVSYEQPYIYAEDYRFWSRLVHAGATVVCTDRPFFKMRHGDDRTTSRHMGLVWTAAQKVQDAIDDWLTESRYAGYVQPEIKDSGKKLTVIMPFLNEGEETVATVRSIRETAGDSVDIMAINDQSTDDYPYEEALRPYDVCYLVNAKRKGVAASRDYGISLCRTPYFLLLDAHMRFYSKGWAERYVALLEQNDRQLLCAQTDFLTKDESGVYHNDKCIPSFGAYMPFAPRHLLPDIAWSLTEACPDSDEEEIPFVLGAGYAASKRYWQYLRGLEGLLYYGSDEAYISLKVWLEGGRCLLVKDTVIGHIYRKKSPYRHYNASEAHNYLWISDLLLPFSCRHLAEATILRRDRELYASVREVWKSKVALRQELKGHYAKILTRNFNDILYMHRERRRRDAAEYFSPYLEKLLAVAGFLASATPERDGLFHGKVGHVLWFEHYRRYSGEDHWEDLASELWAPVEQAIADEALPANFAEGLAGIGWALLYMRAQGFISDLPEATLADIDRQLACCHVSELAADDLAHGGAGILVYAVQRWKQALSDRNPALWSEPFRQELRAVAERIIRDSDSVITLYHALQYQALDNGELPEGDDMPPALHEWLDFDRSMPDNPRHWQPGLCRCAASLTLHAMLVFEHA